MSNKKLPTYYLKFDPSLGQGVHAIALVDRPANKTNWHAFSEEEKLESIKVHFNTLDEEKRIVEGYLLIPEQEIYRKTDEKGEYLVKFSAETIAALQEDFAKNQRLSAFNILHQKELAVQGVYIFEQYITTPTNKPAGLEDKPVGSWYVKAKIDNDVLWEEFIKTGELKAFSIEGNFTEHLIDNKKDMKVKFKEQFDSFTTKLSEMAKELFGEEGGAEGDEGGSEGNSATLQDGREITWEGELSEGTAINVKSEEGDMALEDGDHETADGKVLKVSEGKVTEIIDASGEDEEEERFQEKIEKRLDLLEEGMEGVVGTLGKVMEVATKMSEKMTNTTEAEALKQEFSEIKAKVVKLEASPAVPPVEEEEEEEKEKEPNMYA